ncbi:helix-turn-helix transcriptional regulator [Streptomyces clavuligerus]|uniref:DeoR-family transcriptional regulator n=1 Tax=Streptomyces clavuligerus TaxID=1901 RepID=B5GQ04_STRCL|nr:YafY family protein [Streptomyces clavuligerus]ANW19749.1 transcriptional regulator [Streptomyces clavuligerus]AXU14363.1 YafY family transcriptional regulator [Streptomyces clavuligerus]EDY48400.1 DeoR-family transcriptional regulator [Streptomyces clavuligerus]EFG07407.1 DeoR-family transcriptional regulator [Streptomyces clavuligerus]MBY6304366.1 YafY family transcriptional regulator [Streptomyces clavuligerus]
MTDTPARLLTLLSLLQTPREWPGSELARRLEVSPRTIRRDIDRLRELGYPVEATKGPVGGYRLVAGTAMPPLTLDDEEAVAIAVGLRAGAGHAIEGVEEASVRALAKLEQVLPSRLRHRVTALQAATFPLTRGDGATIDPHTLTTIAGAARGQERLRFDYRAGDSTRTKRLVEPYRLLSTGYRWYLMAYDLERADWRTFRVDRLTGPFPTGERFTPRELPKGGAGELLGHTLMPRQEYDVEVEFNAPAATVAARLPRSLAAPEPLGEAECRLRTRSTDTLEWLALRLLMVGCEFRVVGPEPLVTHVQEMAARLARASGTR